MAQSDGRSDHAAFINKEGVAKLSHFMVTFTAPKAGKLGSALQREGGTRNKIGEIYLAETGNFVKFADQGTLNIAYRCERVSLPGRIIISSPYKEGNMGLVREYPTNAVYQPVDVTMLMSEDYSDKVFFELWQDLIVGHHRTTGDQVEGSRSLNYLRDYACTVTITCFSDAAGPFSNLMEPVYSLTLQEAYPRTIQDIQMDWGSNDVARLNVVFDYKYFEDKIEKNKNVGQKDIQRASILNRTGIGAGLSAFGGRQLARLGPGAQQALTGAAFAVGGAVNAVSSVRSASTSARAASKLFR